ncbi:MAG: hypothetical protein ABW185_28285 [Sedimenticola sp.]
MAGIGEIAAVLSGACPILGQAPRSGLLDRDEYRTDSAVLHRASRKRSYFGGALPRVEGGTQLLA